jgi:ankyrin repeat protein
MTTRRIVLASLLASCTGFALADPGADAQSFFRAVEMDDARSVKQMLERGFDANAVGRTGEPALVQAVRENSMTVLAALLADKRTRVDAQAANGNTALMMAAFKRNRPAFEALLGAGAAIDRQGWTPLHYAAASGDVDIAGLLLARGARIDAVSPKASGSYTPLMLAAREGKQDSVQFLLSKGASKTLRNGEGLTAAQIAERADHADIARAVR